MQFATLDEIRGFCRTLPGGDERAATAALARQASLTKPAGSLGRLEELAAWLARWQGRDMPSLDRVTVAVFAGNHGVAARGVSAYPQEVTKQMVANFAAGGAAINQLARLVGAELRVVPIELDRPTTDFTVTSAMQTEEFLAAIADPHHEEHESMLTWVGGVFDPEGFDVNTINRTLRFGVHPAIAKGWK